MTNVADITIVGAGPYGLSIAAHLWARGLNFKIIGSPMHTWRESMPKGMHLKSAGFASNLSDPDHEFTLRHFCNDRGIPYGDIDFPVSLETFCAYGLAFQKRFVPNLENDSLTALSRCPEGFLLRTESGSSFMSRKVVLAIGMDYIRHVPEPLAHLRPEMCSHSADHHDLQKFRGRDIAVLGRGASAVDIAVLLHEAGAKVQLIARKRAIDFGTAWGGAARPLMRRICEPISPIGPGWSSRVYTGFPWLYRYLPEQFRADRAKNHLPASGGWFMKDRASSVPCLLGFELKEAGIGGGRVVLHLAAAGVPERVLEVDHVIAATGFKSDVHRLPFLGADILSQLQLVAHSPRLSAHFESSVPGLYFVGHMAASSFGPVMRFVAGTEFTARNLSKHLSRFARQRAKLKQYKGEKVPEAH